MPCFIMVSAPITQGGFRQYLNQTNRLATMLDPESLQVVGIVILTAYVSMATS